MIIRKDHTGAVHCCNPDNYRCVTLERCDFMISMKVKTGKKHYDFCTSDEHTKSGDANEFALLLLKMQNEMKNLIDTL